MDPIRLVRDVLQRGDLKDAIIDLKTITFPSPNNKQQKTITISRENSETNYRSKVKDQFLRLDQIVFFLQKCLQDEKFVQDQKEYGKYVKQAIAQKIKTVPRPDFKDLFEYFTTTGTNNNNQRVDLSVVKTVVDLNDGSQSLANLEQVLDFQRDAQGGADEETLTFNELVQNEKHYLRELITVVPYATRNACLKRKKDFTSALEKFDGYVSQKNQTKNSKKEMQEKPKELLEAEKIVERGQRRNRYQEKVEEQTFWKERVGSDFNDLFGNDSLEGGGFDPNASFLQQSIKVNNDNNNNNNASAFAQAMQQGGGGNDYNNLDQQEFNNNNNNLEKTQTLTEKQRLLAQARQQAGGQQKTKSSSQQQQHSKSHQNNNKPIKRQGTPLIIVPAGLNAKIVLNMFNAQNFFEKEKFEPWQDIQKEASKNKTKKPTHGSILRTYKRDQPTKYEITDQVPKSGEDWKRVVAVFVHGANWQFKDWPKHIFPGAATGDLVDTFAKIRGFYAKFEQDQTPETVKTWNVKLLTFRKNQRHGDKALCSEFWDELDRVLELKRSNLLY